MAVFEVPARVKIEIPDEMDVSSGRRCFITLLTQEWLDIHTTFKIKNSQKDGEVGESLVDVSIQIEEGTIN